MRAKSIFSLCLLLFVVDDSCSAFQNLFSSFSPPNSPLKSGKAVDLENELLKAINNMGENRLVNDERITELVSSLEQTRSIPAPRVGIGVKFSSETTQHHFESTNQEDAREMWYKRKDY
jgi:hypothetical protein